MKILFLSHYFSPEVNAPAIRTHEHCRQWVRDGHHVTVVSCVPHHPMGKVYPGYRNKFFQVEYKDGIRIVRVLTYVTPNQGLVRRTLNYVFYMVMVILVAPFLGKVDVVVSTLPQFFNGLAGYGVSRLRRCPWVLEIRDLWPESIVALGAIRNKKVIALLEWLERFMYRKAERIVPVTNAFKSHIIAHGGSEDKVVVIHNGADLTLFVDQSFDEAFAKELDVKGKFIAAYVGTHGMAHGLGSLLDAAEKLRHRRDILFLTAGDGAERGWLESEIKRRALENMRMLGQLPRDKMSALWSITGASLVLLRKKDLFLSVIPSKIFEAMAMKKPVILGVRGESRDIIEKAGSGICIDPGNADQLARAVVLLADNPQMCREMGEAGRVCVGAEFDRKVMARRFEKVFQDVI